MKVVIIGVTGGTGKAILNALARCNNKVEVIALVRNVAKLTPEMQQQITHVIEGDATSAERLALAMAHQPDVVIVSVGMGSSHARTTVRADVTRAVVLAMRSAAPASKLIVMSSSGAGDSMSQLGLATRMVVSVVLKHVLADHTQQERVVEENLEARRWLMVRPTSLNDKPARKDYQLLTTGKARSTSVSREDVAHFIVKQTLSARDDKNRFGQKVTITW